MLFIAHRINTAAELKNIPRNFGVEIDLRDFGDKIVLQHDPYIKIEAEDFEKWLDDYNHALIICNIKSEGIEWRILDILNKRGIDNFFFLDSSLPMIMKLQKAGEKRIAVRYCEVEPPECAMQFVGKCEWLWVDCFSQYPHISDEMKEKFKVCLVGPTLQSHNWVIKDEWKNNFAVCDKKYNSYKWS